MSSNFGLPSLPALGSFIPAGGSSSDTPHDDSGPSIGSRVMGAIGDAATGGALSASGLTVQRVVIVILGLLLIAAGIFAFKPVRETVVETAKTGAKAAAMA